MLTISLCLLMYGAIRVKTDVGDALAVMCIMPLIIAIIGDVAIIEAFLKYKGEAIASAPLLF